MVVTNSAISCPSNAEAYGSSMSPRPYVKAAQNEKAEKLREYFSQCYRQDVIDRAVKASLLHAYGALPPLEVIEIIWPIPFLVDTVRAEFRRLEAENK